MSEKTKMIKYIMAVCIALGATAFLFMEFAPCELAAYLPTAAIGVVGCIIMLRLYNMEGNKWKKK